MSTLQYLMKSLLDIINKKDFEDFNELVTCLDRDSIISTFETDAIVHGVVFPMCTPLLELWAQYCHADMFLYVVFVNKSRLQKTPDHRIEV